MRIIVNYYILNFKTKINRNSFDKHVLQYKFQMKDL